MGGSTLITLQMTEANAKQVFDDLRRQTDLPLEAYSPSAWTTLKKTANVQIAKQPFWAAIRELQNIWDFRLESYPGRPGYTILPYGTGEFGRAQQVGPCLISLTGLNYARSVSFGRDGKVVPGGSFHAAVSAFFDPKIQTLRNSVYCQLEEAVDEKGRSLKSPDAQNGLLYDSNPVRLQLKLQELPNMGKKLARLRGTLGFVAVTSREVWQVPDVLQARDVERVVKRDDGEERYFLDAVKSEGENYIVQLTVSRPRTDTRRVALLGNGRNIFLSEAALYDQVRLVDAQNRDWLRANYRTQIQGDKDTSITSATFTFRKRVGAEGDTGPPAKLIVTIPMQWREVQVPFEFLDLPLP